MIHDVKNHPDRNNENDSNGRINRFSGFLHPAVAAFVIIGFAAIVYLFYSSFYKDEEKKISYKGLYGDTFVNGVIFDEILISSGDKIKTKSDSSSEIEIEKMFFINIYPDSEIEVENSYYSKKYKLNVFNFKIHSGTIYAKFEKSADLSCRFITKDAKIESIGTEFLIEITKEGTMVVVSEGSLSVTCLKNGETKTALADKIFTIKDNIEISDVDKSIEAEESK